MPVSHVASEQLAEPLTLDVAFERAAQAALTESVVGRVGIEVETHLVDLAAVPERVAWHRVEAALPALRSGTGALTVEPGGQIEFSGPPVTDVAAAVLMMRHDVQRARLALLEQGLGLAHLGADPLRPARRVNPRPRYRAMERHYVATGRGGVGTAMMNSTAALQLNLQAGPEASWPARVALAHGLGPPLVAIAACSPWLSGSNTGWQSSRQRVWAGLGCGPLPGWGNGHPAEAWAHYALDAPVLFVQGAAGEAVPVGGRVRFADWASGATRLAGRAPTGADLQSHLSTLFPPVRLRGYLELRYLDMSPPRWWPAVAAVVATLMDDPVAAEAAAEAVEPAAALWTEAARDGLRHPMLAAAARRCLTIAAERAPAQLVTAVCDLAELVDSGRSPADLLAARIAEIGPHRAFEELAHA